MAKKKVRRDAPKRLRKLTLQMLMKKAMRDKAFFRALVSDPDTALLKEKIELTPPGDLKKLKSFLKQEITFSGPKLIGLILQILRNSKPPPPPPWPFK